MSQSPTQREGSAPRTAFVTGAARGIGLATARRLAANGYSIIAIDVAPQPDAAPEWCTLDGDVTNQASLDGAVREGLERFGRLDVVCACAGVLDAIGPTWQIDEADWLHVIDVDLHGVFRTVKATVPALVQAGRGGSMVFVNSIGGMHGVGQTAAYTAAKHGVTGILRSLVNELSAHNIRVNSVHPTVVDTPMIHNSSVYQRFLPHLKHPTREDFAELFANHNALDVPWIQPEDVAEAIAWLVSDAARYVTGVQLPVDTGLLEKA
jgi:NAD(P)-dependent dehydrogenase (short-subunit alcohol dehydrogenase family)